MIPTIGIKSFHHGLLSLQYHFYPRVALQVLTIIQQSIPNYRFIGQPLMSQNQFSHSNQPQANPQQNNGASKEPVIFQENHDNSIHQNYSSHDQIQPIIQNNELEQHKEEVVIQEDKEKGSATAEQPQKIYGEAKVNQNEMTSEGLQLNEEEKAAEPQYNIDQNEFNQQQDYLSQQKNIIKLAAQQQFDQMEQGSHKFVDESNHEDNSRPFNWGQDEDDHTQSSKQKKSFSEFFLNSNLAKSQQILVQSGLGQKKDKKYQKNAAKKLVSGDVDIWQDLRNSMIEKSRASLELKNSKLSSIKILSDKIQHKLKVGQPNLKPISIFSKPEEKKNILKIGRQQQKDQAVQNISIMNKEIMQKVRKWKKQQREIEARRIEKLNSSKQKVLLEIQKEQEDLERQKNIEKKSRVKAISQRLQKKLKRKLSSTSEKQKVIEKQKSKLKKSKTQKNYKNDRDLSQKHNQKIKQPQQFSIHWNRKDNQIQQAKQRQIRRKIFQEKVKDLPVSTSPDKKLKLLIQIDKKSNPLKYQFLSKRGISQEEIFREHSNFKLPESPKKIGIKYLKDIREQNKLDDIKRYMSQQSLLNIKKHQRSWKSPLLENPKILEPLLKPAMPKQEQKRAKLYEQDDKYLYALKK